MPRPRPWLLVLALPVVLLGWITLLEGVMPPLGSLSSQRRLLLWLVPPLLIVLAAILVPWGLRLRAHRQAQRRVEQESQAREALVQAEARAAESTRLQHQYSLEVYGLGLHADRFDGSTLWGALVTGDAWTSLLSTDASKVPWSGSRKMGVMDSRAGRAFAAALRTFPEKWELPFLLSGPPILNPDAMDDLQQGLCGARTGMGMHYHRFRTLNQVHDLCPDHLLGDAFRLFDQEPTLPALAITGEDGDATRDLVGPEGGPYRNRDGYELPQMTDSTAVLVLGRADRVATLRPTATDQRVDDVLAYIETYRMDTTGPGTREVYSYDPAPPEPQLPDAQGVLRPWWVVQGGAPAAFKPSRWVMRPWCKEQLEQFDALSVLARVHRPQQADFRVQGRPLGPDARARAFQDAWTRALATLPQGQRPVRVVYDTGPGNGGRVALITQALKALGPDLEIPGRHGIDLAARLGDTGATSPTLVLGVGVLATRRDGGVTAVVHLGHPARATITMVSPPAPGDRVHQDFTHP